MLDEAFDDAGVEVEPRNNNNNNNNNNNQCSSCDMAVCVMGGGNSQVQRAGLSCYTECFTILCQGAVSDVASVTPDGDRRRARGLYIAPFPSFMTRAGGQVRSRDMS